MSILDDLKPESRQKVYDLVALAGVDVSDWSNYKNGERAPAANPRYCYNWSFVEPHKTIVLNVWWEDISEDGGILSIDLNPDRVASALKGVQASRAGLVKSSIHYAMREGLPIRFIVCDGERVPLDRVAEDGASKVKTRMLDPAPWHVAHFNSETGDFVFERGEKLSEYIDQFSLKSVDTNGDQKQLSVKVYNRSPKVRESVLMRAKGKCEYCGETGFKMFNGAMYLETHHIIPLSKSGPDSTSNVIALCPNHHREAHYSDMWKALQVSFSKIVMGKT
ncbi:MAG: HNH endonuclease signature motif containing protein [Cellvibrionales bacterium]|nr:HNH endonuclease signature motif containing protein [Cellvibrionales bacterium]